ncbi:MAG TPA: hypothetical protein VMZ53_26255 [Kofleriaceae bacterium]|nr:hypothetical protein [Kofleriaceae bacterium]
MPDLASSSSSVVDLGPPRWKKIVVIGGGITAVAVVAAVALKLIFTVPGGAACDHLDELPGGDQVVQRLENYVESHVVEAGLVREQRHEVSGCRAALSALDQTMTHGRFTRMTECIEKAKTAADASRCI